jgi:hypothetical protein
MTIIAQISDLHVQIPGKLAYGIVDTNNFSQFVMEPTAYQLHIWTGENLVSHMLFVGEFDGPFRFSDGKKVVATSY